MIDDRVSFYLIVLPFVGFYFLWQAQKILIYKDSVLPPVTPISLFVIRILKGDEAAKAKMAEISKPEKVRNYGITALITGIISFIAELLLLVGTLINKN